MGSDFHQVHITCGIPHITSDTIKAEFDHEDTIHDLIGRVCLVWNLKQEPRMFFLSEEGVEVGGSDKATTYLTHGLRLSLRTRKVPRFKWITSLLGALLGVISALLAVIIFTHTKVSTDMIRAVVVDAGSSHTSALLYEWSPNLIGGTGLPFQVEELYWDTPIGSFAGQEDKLMDFMGRLIGNVSHWIEDEAIPMYVAATAGMRILMESQPEEALAIMRVVEQVVDESEFDLGEVEILSGESEGVYGWIATNILSGSLPASPKSQLKLALDSDTQGSLDMGGGSSQIAYSCTNCSDPIEITIFNRQFPIQSTSSSCYGLKEAMFRYLALLIFDAYSSSGSTLPSSMANPCVNPDFPAKDDWLALFPTRKEDIFSSNCTLIQDPTFMALIDALGPTHEFSFDSSYDSGKCTELLSTFTNQERCQVVFDNDCLDPSLISPSNTTFFAVSSYFYNFRLPLELESASTYDQVAVKIQDICTQPQACQSCSETDCFEVSYIFQILTQGYNFEPDLFPNVFIVDNINGDEVAWTLGYATFRSSEIGVRQGLISTPVFAIWIGFSLVLTFFSLFALNQFSRAENDRTLIREPPPA